MYPEHPIFEGYLNFGYSSFGKTEFQNKSFHIIVNELWVLNGHPNYDIETHLPSCTLEFENVLQITGFVAKYELNEQGEYMIDSQYDISHGPFQSEVTERYLFHISGVSNDLVGWIEWEIIASSYRIHVPDKYL